MTSTLKLLDFLEDLWRWRWVALAATLLSTLVALYLVAGMPNVYRSQARFLVSAPREAVNASRALGFTQGFAPFSPSDSAMAVFSSRDLMVEVAKRLGPEAILAPEPPSADRDEEVSGLKGLLLPLMRAFQRRAAATASPRTATLEAAVLALQGSLKFYSDQRSPSIQVVCRAASAGRAQGILQAFVEEGMKFYIRLRSSEGDKQFVVQYQQKAYEEAERAQREFQEFLQANQISDLAAELANLGQLYTELDRQIGQDELSLVTLKESLRQLEEDIRQYEPLSSQPAQEVELPNPRLQRLDEQVLQDEVRLTELKARAVGGNAEIRQLEEKIKGLKELRQKEAALGPYRQRTTTLIPNPEYEARRTAIRERQLALQGLEAGLPARRKAKEDLLKRIQALRGLEARWAELKRRAAQADEQKIEVEARLRQFLLSKELDARGLLDVQVVESPSFEPRKEGPVREKYLLLGLLAPSLLLVPLVLLLTRLLPRLRRPDQLEALFGVAVPAAVPHLSPGNLRRYLQARNRGWQ